MLFASTTSRLKDSLKEKAAQLLVTPTALANLSAPDARVVVGIMLPQRLKQGTVFIQQGEAVHTDFMMLLVEGEVLVQNDVTPDDGGTVMSVIGAGSMIGEMGLLDGEPRSATCSAITDLVVAVLPREALLKLFKSKPAVAARFMLAISKRLSDRLREANRKIKILDCLSRALQQELDAAHKLVGNAIPEAVAKPLAKSPTKSPVESPVETHVEPLFEPPVKHQQGKFN